MFFCHRCQAVFDTGVPERCPACDGARPTHGWPGDPRLGTLVGGGQYRVKRRLGTGGFGCVYLVETVVGGLRRALKVLHAEWTAHEATRERFINEALVLEQVNHPNVARCYAAGVLEESGALYLLFELVEGVPLGSLVDSPDGPRPLTPLRAVRLARQVAAGLVAAHATRVLHRDLTPANVLVTNAGAADEQVKIVDFGIAKAIDCTTPATSGVLGTPAHMAPEQRIPGAPQDERLDLWQLGAMFFLMLTGATPFGSELRPDDVAVRESGPEPGRVVPALAAIAGLDRLVSRLLAGSPQQRPRSAAAVCAELARIEHTLTPGLAAGSHALIEALCASPGDANWAALCRYLAGPLPERSRVVGIAETLLAGWPEDTRPAAAGWWEAVREGRGHELWPLARTLDLSGRELTDADVDELAACPALASISRLSLAGNRITNAGVAALARSPHAAGLRSLDLSGNRLSSAAVEALVESASLRGLTALNLAENGVGTRGAEALAQNGPALRRLDLSGNDVQAAGAAAIAASPALATLERLSLRGNGLGSDGVSAIVTSRTLLGLRSLDVSLNRVGSAGVAALALAAASQRLVELSIAQNDLGLEGLELLLASTRLTALEALDLSSTRLGAAGALTLASSVAATRRLTRLHVADNALGDAGLAALIGSPHVSRLTRLDLSQNGVTAAGIALLAAGPPELSRLALARNPLGDLGAATLAATLSRTRVSSLDVSECGLGSDGLAALLTAAHALTTLTAGGNPIGPGGGTAQTTAAWRGAALVALDLAHAGLGADGAVALLRSSHARRLQTLSLAGNEIGDEGGARIVAELDALPALSALSLRDNRLGPDAARALAASPAARRLVELDLGGNRLGEAGVTALAATPGWHALRKLDLSRNEVTFSGAAAVLASPGLASVEQLGLAGNPLRSLPDLHGLGAATVGLVEASFARIATAAPDFAERFYAELFRRHPSLAPLFAHVPLRRQAQHLIALLSLTVEHLRNPDLAAAHLEEVGARHAAYGARVSHYALLMPVLLDTLREASGEEWNPRLEAAWHDGLDAISAAVLRGQVGSAEVAARTEAPHHGR